MSKDQGLWKGEGTEEVEALYKLCCEKKMYLGALIKPKRNLDELREEQEPANIVLVVASSRAMSDSIVLSDEVVSLLSESALFLTEELKNYGGN